MSHILEFLDLVDVPDTYSGSGGYRLRVNSTPDGVEFVADTFTNLSDTPSDYSGFPDYYLKVNSGASAVEFQSAANLETALGGPFLPLTAGSGEPLTGNLYIDTATTAGLFVRPGGSSTNNLSLVDATSTIGALTLQRASGAANLRIDSQPDDNTSDASIDLFRTTDTVGSVDLNLYVGDNTATLQHVFEADTGNATLCQQGGNVTIDEGVLYLDKTFTPAIHLRENAVNNDRFTISSTAGIHALYAHDGSGQSLVRIDPLPDDGSGAALMQLFRTTSTTGNRYLDIFLGDGTATTQHRFYSTGNVELCKTAGYVKIEEGHLYLDHTTSPSLYLREGGSATDYSRIYDDGNDLNIARYDTDGHSYLYIDAHTSFGSGSGFVNINRNANNFGTGGFRVFPSDGTATVIHELTGGGDADLCKGGGTLSENSNAVLTEGSSEFSALTEKTTPVSADLLIIEDSAASNAKKKVQMTNLPAGAPSMPLRVDTDIHANLRRYIGTVDFHSSSPNQTGAFVIRPFGSAADTTSTFFRFEITGWEWNSDTIRSGAWKIVVGGYWQGGTPQWNNIGRHCEIVYGTPPIDVVRLSRDASGYACVVLGLTSTDWDYPALSVDAWSGYTGADDWSPTDATITLDASLTSFTHDRKVYLSPKNEYIRVTAASGQTLSSGDICYISGHSGNIPEVTKADADAEATATGQLVMCVEAIASTAEGRVILRGEWPTTSMTPNDIYYLSTTAGGRTTTAPSGVGDIVRIIGKALSSDRFFFDPSDTWIEIGGGIGSYMSCTDLHCSNFTVGTSPTDIEFDAERQTHDDFTHSMVTNPEEVTCNFDGKVKITVTGNILENAANTTWFKLQKNTGAGYADISDSYHYITSAATSNVYNGFSIEIIESVSDGDIIKLVGDATGSTASLQYCRMNLVKLEHGVAPAAANTGVPAHRSVVYTDSQIYAAASTWATVFNLTSHSYDGGMLYYLYNDYASDTAAQRYYFKVTVDGSYVITSNTYLRGGATYSSGIGPIAITQCITPIYFSTQCKLEVGNYGTAGTKYYRYAYYLYDLV